MNLKQEKRMVALNLFLRKKNKTYLVELVDQFYSKVNSIIIILIKK